MRDYLRKITEGIIVRGILSIIQVAVTTAAVIIIPAFTVSSDNAVLIAIEAGLAVVILLTVSNFFSKRRYPPFKVDFEHTSNHYILSFQNRENIEYVRRLTAKTLKDGLEGFADGEYTWTGNKSEAKLNDEDKDDFRLELLEREPGSKKQKYIVHAKNRLRQYKKYSYGVSIMLGDENHEMVAKNSISIKRPTGKIVLELNYPNTVGIKNVRFIARSELGDQCIFYSRKPKIKPSGGGVRVNNYSYKFVVRRPKLSSEYAVTWEWE